MIRLRALIWYQHLYYTTHRPRSVPTIFRFAELAVNCTAFVPVHDPYHSCEHHAPRCRLEGTSDCTARSPQRHLDRADTIQVIASRECRCVSPTRRSWTSEIERCPRSIPRLGKDETDQTASRLRIREGGRPLGHRSTWPASECRGRENDQAPARRRKRQGQELAAEIRF